MTEEYYQDGIKLPTDKDIPWEIVSKCGGTLYRMKIENGYLYLKTSISGSDGSMCFVPDNKPELSEDDTFILMNKVAELSSKLKKMQDSLREFDKEKVDPLKVLIGAIDERNDKSLDRLDKLELFRKLYFDEFNIIKNWISANEERIQKLEKELDVVTIGFSERVAKLESALKPKFETNAETSDHILTYLCEQRIKEANHYHPRDTVRLCPHGHPIFESKINCTACY